MPRSPRATTTGQKYSIEMAHITIRALRKAVALLCMAGALANSAAIPAMATTKALFFSNGLEQRLEVAVRADDPVGIDQLLNAGARVDARGLHDVTPLMIAVDAQSPRAVAALLRASANPNLKAADGAGAVHLAVENHATKPSGHAILQMIMKSGGDPNTLRPDRDPVIARFLFDHDLDDLRWFAAFGANVDIVGRGFRPLIANAAFGQNWDGVWCLVELGAKYDYENTLYPLSEALDSPYGSSPDGSVYPYKRKVWQLMKDKGLTVRPWKE